MDVVVLMTRSKVKSARENLQSGGVMFTRSRGVFKVSLERLKLKNYYTRINGLCRGDRLALRRL